MNVPRPRPRLAPRDVLRATRKDRISRAGSCINDAGFSRTVLEALRWTCPESERSCTQCVHRQGRSSVAAPAN